jgi:ATP-dependent Clp protease ATP-binding subunit ClpB
MRFDKLTVKAQEALASARDLAAARRHAEVLPEHLLTPWSTRTAAWCRASWQARRRPAGRRRRPRPRAGQAADRQRRRRRRRAVAAAQGRLGGGRRRGDKLKDEFLSTEHFVLALAPTKGAAGEALRQAGATPEALLEALLAVRGNQRVTDQNPEATYEALDKLPATSPSWPSRASSIR